MILSMINTEQQMQDYLKETLDWASNEDGMIKTIDTFEEIGVMTNNKGLLVRMQDGSRFQLVIVKSR
jgi:hypothetical protein